MTGQRSERGTALTELELIGLVSVTWAAALLAIDLPTPVGVAAVAISAGVLATVRSGHVRNGMLAVGIFVIAASLSARAEADYVASSPRTLAGEPATLVTDTEPSDFGWRAEAKLDTTGERVRLMGAGFQRPDLIAGQPVLLSGRLGPADGNDWNKSLHVVGVVAGADVVAAGDLAWWRHPGEWLRSGVLGATGSFDEKHAALYHGLVIGDDRFQGVGQRAQFRAAGLSHLLAVSGQNVAFLLAVIAPLTARMRPTLALAAIAVALVVFALATRLEPSVLRATATAGVSTLAAMRSARAAGLRSLSIAVIVLLFVDPFLAWSVGFRLSVGASTGILLLGPLIRSRLPWPAWLATPVSITVAAQIGVSPILLLVFGPVATVTIPANLLAGWAAGAVMTLGLSVGLLASLLPEGAAAVLQLPSRWLVWWIDVVAAEAAVAPLPSVSIRSLPWIGVAALVVWWLRPGRWTRLWWLPPLALVVSMSSAGSAEIDGWHPRTTSTPSVLVITDPTERWVDLVVANRLRHIDLVVVADGGWTTARTIDRLRDVVDIGLVLAPGDHRIVGGRRVLADEMISVGAGSIVIAPAASHLDISVVDHRATAVDDPDVGG